MLPNEASSESSAEAVAELLRQFDALTAAEQDALIAALVRRVGFQRTLSLVSICVEARIEEIRDRE